MNIQEWVQYLTIRCSCLVAQLETSHWLTTLQIDLARESGEQRDINLANSMIEDTNCMYDEARDLFYDLLAARAIARVLLEEQYR